MDPYFLVEEGDPYSASASRDQGYGGMVQSGGDPRTTQGSVNPRPGRTGHTRREQGPVRVVVLDPARSSSVVRLISVYRRNPIRIQSDLPWDYITPLNTLFIPPII